jgi:uncharacterized protein
MGIDIVLYEEVDLANKYLISGFHGIGEVGYIAVKYMIEATNAKRIGYIISKLTPPLVSLDEKGELLLPFELFLDENGFVYLLIRFQPHADELREFTMEIVKFIQDHAMRGMVLLGGLDLSFKPEDDEKGYRCVVTNDFPLADPPLIDPGLFISGGVAMALIELQVRKIQSLTLFPFAERDKPDMNAAAKAIEIINKIFVTDIQTDKLQEQTKELEKEVAQILKQQAKEEPSRDLYT